MFSVTRAPACTGIVCLQLHCFSGLATHDSLIVSHALVDIVEIAKWHLKASKGCSEEHDNSILTLFQLKKSLPYIQEVSFVST